MHLFMSRFRTSTSAILLWASFGLALSVPALADMTKPVALTKGSGGWVAQYEATISGDTTHEYTLDLITGKQVLVSAGGAGTTFEVLPPDSAQAITPVGRITPAARFTAETDGAYRVVVSNPAAASDPETEYAYFLSFVVSVLPE